MKIKCINCGYFLNCKNADENITECSFGVKANRNFIEGIDEECLENKMKMKKTMRKNQIVEPIVETMSKLWDLIF